MAEAMRQPRVSSGAMLGEQRGASPGPVVRVVTRMVRDRGGRFGVGVLIVLVAIAVLAPAIAPYDPYAIGAGMPFAAPSAEHLLGTDNLGRDVFTRVMYGGRISLTIALASAAVAIVLALPLGVLAGFLGGAVDSVIARVFDTIFAFPSILIGIGFVAIFGSSIRNVVLAVAIINVPTLGRLMRVAILGQKSEDYVEAAWASGATGTRVALRHIFPNALPPLLVQIALLMGEAVLLEAAFSFLGLGNRPPTPSWGVMLNEGRAFLAQAWWLGFFPGLAITLMILALNAVGDSLRTALDPRGS